MTLKKQYTSRWSILTVGVFTMLFAGIIYAWSILKIPFAEELGYQGEVLALNFTLTMSFFCIGGVISNLFVRRLGTGCTLILAGLMAGIGFILSSFLNSGSAWMLYLTYAFLGGSGIGIAYIVIISTVNAWFPDKRGTSSGALMMGFGTSSLILGNAADALFRTALGWRMTYIILGAALAVVLIVAAMIIRKPDPSITLPVPKKKSAACEENFVVCDFTPLEMIRRFSFWRAFLAFLCITAVGNSVISFARDLALSVGAEAALATTLVGVLAVCNGIGRIITGTVFDAMGRRFTMIAANILTIAAAAVTLIAVCIGSLPLCIAGLCLTGMSYGSAPTNISAFTSAFYGTGHFASNLGILNLNLMFASFVATACSSLFSSTGGYTAPFILLLALATVALGLNISIRKP